MEKLKMHSPNLTQDNLAHIRDLFPGCVTEAKAKDGSVKLAVDFDLLRQELAEWIVEGPQERYHLNWPGKREALLAANAPIAKTLRPCREESVDFDNTKNLFIEGDNLDALKLLQETYLGKIKLIYIDPPYNTGNDFIYADDFSVDSTSYLGNSNQIDEAGGRMVANTESNGRFHSDWLDMMYPRLKLAKNLLKDDGAIFISIDDNEVENLKNICSEIFGSANFLGQISVVSNLKGRSDDKYFATAHNYLLAYSKGNFVTNGVPLPADYLDAYGSIDESGRKYRLQGLRKRGSSARREDRPNMFYPFYVNSSSGDISLSPNDVHTVEVLPKLSDGSDGRWRWGKQTAQERLQELTAQTVGSEKRWDIFQIDYADADGEAKRVKPKSVWMGPEFANESGTLEVKELLGKGIFDTPKPIGLVQYILEQSVEDEDIVLDFFAGSATTAHAVLQKNAEETGRCRFIVVQLPDICDESSTAFNAGYRTIAEISKERIRRTGNVLGAAYNMDVGFRVLKIDTSNMADVYYSPDALDMANFDLFVENIKPDRTPEDLLFQVMLDWGVDLTLPISKQFIQGKDVFFVDGNALAACFDASGSVDEVFVKELARQQPLRVVFRDAGYKDSAVKINVEQIFKLLSPATDVKCI